MDCKMEHNTLRNKLMGAGISCFVLLSTSIGFAGNPLSVDGGVDGGGAWARVCIDTAQKRIVSAQLLDLYEGELYYNLAYPEDTYDKMSADELANLLIGRIANGRGEGFREALVSGSSIMPHIVRWLKPGERLIPTKDSKHDLSESYSSDDEFDSQVRCAIRPIANYTEEGVLLVVTDYFEKLRPWQQTALLRVHEPVWRALKNMEEKTSKRTRRLVAMAAAGSSTSKVHSKDYENSYVCTTLNEEETTFSGSHFFVSLNEEKNGINLDFDLIGSVLVLSNMQYQLDFVPDVFNAYEPSSKKGEPRVSRTTTQLREYGTNQSIKVVFSFDEIEAAKLAEKRGIGNNLMSGKIAGTVTTFPEGQPKTSVLSCYGPMTITGKNRMRFESSRNQLKQ